MWDGNFRGCYDMLVDCLMVTVHSQNIYNSANLAYRPHGPWAHVPDPDSVVTDDA